MDAFQFRKLAAQPAATDSIAVYTPGTANLVASITDLTGTALANPFTPADAGGVDGWGFCLSTAARVDVFWVEGGVYLAENTLIGTSANIPEPKLTGATANTDPQDNDVVYGGDTSASNATIKSTWTTIKAFLKTYFDTLYALTGHNHSGTYEPADATILKDADIGSTVQAYDANLEVLATAYTRAAELSPATLALAEIASGGTSKTILSGATSLTEDVTITFPGETCTLQKATDNLTALDGAWTPAGATSGEGLRLAESLSGGGSNSATLRCATDLTGDIEITLPATGGTLALAGEGGGSVDWANPIAITTTPTTLTIGKHHVVTETSADRTHTLPAASGNGGKQVSVFIDQTTTKVITIDGNASETINGVANMTMRSGQYALFLCDGSNWSLVTGYPTNIQTFSSDGTWTKPKGCSFVQVRMWGGGGGGGAGQSGAAGSVRGGGSGGGGGACTVQMLAASDLSDTETVVIGAGGTGGTDAASPAAATAGGATSFGAKVYAYGGGAGAKGGTTQSNASSGGGGGGQANVGVNGVKDSANSVSAKGGTNAYNSYVTNYNHISTDAFGGGGGGAAPYGGSAVYGGGAGGGSVYGHAINSTGIGGGSVYGGTGGGCGGTVTTANAAVVGGRGGPIGEWTHAQPSNNGAAIDTNGSAGTGVRGGGGGGGGSASTSTNGNNGANGGARGGGGGGGGGGTGTNVAGSGGNGGAGYVEVIAW